MVVLFVYVQMIFVITEIVCAPIGTGTALRKNRLMRVPIYSIDNISPRTSVQILQSGRTGIEGVTVMILEIMGVAFLGVLFSLRLGVLLPFYFPLSGN